MSKVHKALQMLEQRLSLDLWREGERIPSCAELAEICGVSRVTMWRALDQARQKGLIHTRGKLIIKGKERPAPAALSPGFAWERLKRRLGGEILRRELSVPSLYPLNRMALHYGVAVNTLKRALEALHQEGLLIRNGRRYSLPPVAGPSLARELLLISPGNAETGLDIANPRVEWIVRSFEEECLRTGYQNHSFPFSSSQADSLIRLTSFLKTCSNLQGIVVNVLYPWSDLFWRRWLDMLAFVSGLGVPVILLDPLGGIQLPKQLMGKRTVRLLCISARRAGEIVGEAILRNGHRRAAYIMPSAKPDWARLRGEGLQKAFREYGGTGAEVEIHTFSETVDMNQLILAMAGLGREEVRAVFGERLASDQAEELAAMVDYPNHPRLVSAMPGGKVQRTVHTFSAFLKKLVKETHDPWVYEQLVDTLHHVTSNIAQDAYTTPFFEPVSTRSKATVWVSSDDKTCLQSLAWLQKHGRRVPEDIALIGFDNWGEALQQGLSSYDFNSAGMVREAMLMIMDDRYRKNQPAQKEIDGFVVERRTTRRL